MSIVKSQEALIQAGYLKGKADGVWGEKSHAALMLALAGVPAAAGQYVIMVRRRQQKNDYTISSLECSWSNFKAVVMEPPGPDTSTAGKNRRIPAGTYEITPHSGEKYKDVVCLHNDYVPKSRAILIHQGNYPKNTQGCLLIGTEFINDSITQSIKALAGLMAEIDKIGADKIKVVITNVF